MDCIWSDWKTSECLGTCGNGTQILTREKILYHQHVPPHYHHIPVHLPVPPASVAEEKRSKDLNQYDQDQHHGYEKRSLNPPTTTTTVRKECIGESTKTVICRLHPCPGMY